MIQKIKQDIKKPQDRKKRVSKKSKGSWRKHSNIKDVEEFLQDKSQDERIGDFSEKANDELFHVDAKPNAKLLVSLRERRKKIAAKPPRSWSALENSSKVKDPVGKRNHVRLQAERKHFMEKMSKKQPMQRQLMTKTKKNIKQKNSKKIDFEKDIWNEEKITKFNIPWIPKHVATHNIRNTGDISVPVPKSTHQNRSQLNAVTLPHPGMSYNPSFGDHQNLMQDVLEEESKFIKQEEHLNRVTTALFDKKTVEQRDAQQLKELMAESEDSDEEIGNDISEIKSVNPPVVVKPKDEKHRKKKREQNEINEMLSLEKMEKKKITDIHRLKHLKTDVDKLEVQLKANRARKKVKHALKKIEPRAIGKEKFKPLDTEMAMPQEISGNLRNVKLEGSILADRFKSLQQRNILPPSIDLGLRRRHEVKRFVRKSHQETPEQPQKKGKKSFKVLA